MLQIDKIQTVKDEEFRNLLLNIYTVQAVSNTSHDLILPNDNNKTNKNIKLQLAWFLYRKLYNDKLVNALSIGDRLKYKKQFEVVRNLLLHDSTEYYDILKEIVALPQDNNMYSELISFIRSQGIIRSDNLDRKIIEFVNDEDNKDAVYGTKQTYLSLNGELKKIKNSRNYDSTSISHNISNIGEYMIFEQLEKNLLYPKFISKDIGDGFGYDIHHFNISCKESINEVKSTIRKNDNDSFTLSDNEYRVLLDCLDNNYREYFLYRVYFDVNNIKSKSITKLKPLDENTLISDNPHNNFKYVLTESEKGKVYKKELN